MKLLFEDRIASWCDSFDVYDEMGRTLFRIVARRDGVQKRLKVYASYLHNKSVATLKESLDEAPAVEIKHGTKFVSFVRYSKPRKIFDFGLIGWYAAGDFDKGNFRIYDVKNRTVATIGTAFTNGKYFRVIDTLPEYTLHSLTFTLAVHVQISESLSPPLAATLG